MQVELWEPDGGWRDNNRLGVEEVTTDILDHELKLTFRNGVNYELTYRVVAKATTRIPERI